MINRTVSNKGLTKGSCVYFEEAIDNPGVLLFCFTIENLKNVDFSHSFPHLKKM